MTEIYPIVDPSNTMIHELGTRKIDQNHKTYKYAKIDFGIVGIDSETDEIYRHIIYGWIRVR